MAVDADTAALRAIVTTAGELVKDRPGDHSRQAENDQRAKYEMAQCYSAAAPLVDRFGGSPSAQRDDRSSSDVHRRPHGQPLSE